MYAAEVSTVLSDLNAAVLDVYQSDKRNTINILGIYILIYSLIISILLYQAAGECDPTKNLISLRVPRQFWRQAI